MLKVLDGNEREGIAPERVARTIVEAVEARRPDPLYAVGSNAPGGLRAAPRRAMVLRVGRPGGPLSADAPSGGPGWRLRVRGWHRRRRRLRLGRAPAAGVCRRSPGPRRRCRRRCRADRGGAATRGGSRTGESHHVPHRRRRCDRPHRGGGADRHRVQPGLGARRAREPAACLRGGPDGHPFPGRPWSPRGLRRRDLVPLPRSPRRPPRSRVATTSSCSLPELVELAEGHGFAVVAVHEASQDEWDAFESGFTAGCATWLVDHGPDHPDATAVRDRAARQHAAYLGGYRGTLGMAYLQRFGLCEARYDLPRDFPAPPDRAVRDRPLRARWVRQLR